MIKQEKERLLESPEDILYTLQKSFPIETEEEFQQIEKLFPNKEVEKKLIKIFTDIISVNRQLFLKRIASKKLIINYNWNGTRNKLPLKNYYLYHTVLRQAYGTNLGEFEQAMKMQVRKLHADYHIMVYNNRNKLKNQKENISFLSKVSKQETELSTLSEINQESTLSKNQNENSNSSSSRHHQIEDVYDASPKLQSSIRSIYKQLNRMSEFLETIVDIMGTHFNNKTTESPQVSDSFVDIFPINTQNDFDQFVNNLETDQAYRDFIAKKCRQIVEKYQDNFLQFLITDNLLYKYNWEGIMNKKSMRMDTFFSEVLLDATDYDIQTYVDSIREQILDSHNRSKRRKSLRKSNIELTEYSSHNTDDEMEDISYDEETYEEGNYGKAVELWQNKYDDSDFITDQDIDKAASESPTSLPQLLKSTQEIREQQEALLSKIEKFYNPTECLDQKFPLSTEAELNNLSKKLNDPEYHSKMIAKCMHIVSLNPETFLRYFASGELLFDFNWDGIKNKKALKKNIFFNDVLLAAYGGNIVNFEKSMKMQIKKSHARSHRQNFDKIHRKPKSKLKCP